MLARILFVLLVLAPGAVLAQSADEIVARADAVRNPGTPFSLVDTLIEYRQGREQNRMTLTVFSKEDQASGQFRSLIRFDQPPRDQGKLMLKDGNILWFYDPASQASVRISPQERLLGQASNGDVVTVNYAKDYKATSLAEETVQDADRHARDCWRLDLVARSDSVTYDHIEYWVEKGSYRPVKGKYYSDSGRLLKTAFFRRYETVLGGERPTETIILDGVDAGLATRMLFTGWRARDIPESWFQRAYLPRLKAD